jgi:hypothetical protein
MFNKVIEKTAGLEIVSHIDDLNDFSEAIKHTKAEWAIVFLQPEEQVPEIVDQIIQEQSSMRFLILGMDGSHARMLWHEIRELPLEEKNLQELLSLIRMEKQEKIQV